MTRVSAGPAPARPGQPIPADAPNALRTPGAAGADPAESYTVDELATRTGLTVRTVRFYASEGLLPPPARRGRVAYYDAQHRLRLDLIRTLQEHGYTLSAIQRVLARMADDASPGEFAVQSAVLAPWLPDRVQQLDRGAIGELLGHPVSDEQLAYLVSVGAAQPVHPEADGRYLVAPAMLGQAIELMRLPVPPEVLTESVAIISEHATQVADGLTDLFARAIWGPYQRGELDDAQVVAILERMRPLALQGLLGAFAVAADGAARRRLED